MTSLNQLKDTHRTRKTRRRVGRGIGSGLGKTCGRGEKGAGSRSGYKRRWGYEGGQMRLYMKLPTRGFSNARFRRPYDVVSLKQINDAFDDGDTVCLETLVLKGLLSGPTYGIKLLGQGELTKKVTIELDDISETAKNKLDALKIQYTISSMEQNA